jgi:FkbM family methyltransferase
LIEPVTEMFKEIVKRQRNVYTLNACIADSKPYIAKIRVAGYLSGIEEQMSEKHKQRFYNQKQANRFSNEGKYVHVPCFSLYTILKAINVETVDFFSLDIEGGEWNVIKSLPYEKIEFKTFVIEYTANPSTTGLIKTRLAENGFRLLKQDNQDLFFTQKKYQVTS